MGGFLRQSLKTFPTGAVYSSRFRVSSLRRACIIVASRKGDEAITTTIYIDSLALLNGIINYFLLLIAAKIVDAPVRRVRLLLGALLGAGYAVAVVFPPLAWLSGFVGKTVCAGLMVLIAFGGLPWKRLLRLGLVFFVVSVTLGGVALLLGFSNIQLDFKTLLLTSGVSYAVLTLLFRRLGRHSASETVSVTVTWGDKHCSFTALKDSGHTLTDPFSGAPVLVADWHAVKNVLPSELRSFCNERALRDPLSLMEQLSACGLGIRARLLPFRAVGTDIGFLLAVRPDSITVSGQKMERALLALSPTPVSDGASISALVSAH